MVIIRALIAILFACVLTASAQAQTTHVRQNLHEFVKDQSKLISLIRGILVMKQRNTAPKDSAAYRMSWEYWAAIHGYTGAASRFGTVADIQQGLVNRFPEDAPLYAGFFTGLTDMTAPADPPNLAQSVWATCEHGTEHFFSWHRMYLYFFERVLRQASGDPNFALPYWDYTNPGVDPAAPGDPLGSLPSIFAVPSLQTTGGPIPNPLFDARRTSQFGFAVQLDPALTDVDSVLSVTDFFQFQSDLDGGLHGHIHCSVGNSCLAPYMGLIPFSANDPIFWVHHANVDRLWDCWTAKNGRDKNPLNDPNWMNKEFSFVDENGQPVSMKVAELFDPKGRIDYSYDNTMNCLRAPAPAGPIVAMKSSGLVLNAAAAAPMRSEIASSANVQLNQLSEEVPLVAPGGGLGKDFLLSARPNVLQPQRTILKLEQVKVDKEPGASVAVYLVSEDSQKRAFVGVLSFFALFAHPAHDKQAATARDYSFDVSRQVQELTAGGVVAKGIRVVLVASRSLVGEADPINEKRYSEAGIKIGKITLEAESTPAVIDLK